MGTRPPNRFLSQIQENAWRAVKWHQSQRAREKHIKNTAKKSQTKSKKPQTNPMKRGNSSLFLLRQKAFLEENSHDGQVAVPLLTRKHFNGCIKTGILSNFPFLNDCAFRRGCTEALRSKITVLLHWRANRSNYRSDLLRPGGLSA